MFLLDILGRFYRPQYGTRRQLNLSLSNEIRQCFLGLGLLRLDPLS